MSDVEGLLPFLVEYPPILSLPPAPPNAVCAFFTRVWHSEAHDSLQSSDPLLLPSQQFAIIAG